jgi:type IV secretion system protein VirB10
MTTQPDANAAGNTSPTIEDEPDMPNVAQPKTVRVSWKGISAVASFALLLIAVTAISIHWAFFSSEKGDEASATTAGERPTAAATAPRTLDMTLPPVVHAHAPASSPIVPAIVPMAEDRLPDPIGVRRQPSNGAPAQQRVAPEDAPVLLVSTTAAQAGNASRANTRIAEHEAGDPGANPLEATQRNLEAYQRQLQGLLNTMTHAMAGDGAPPSAGTPPTLAAALTGPATTPGLFGGQLQSSATPRLAATTLGNRSLTLPKGTSFTCALTTRIVSATSGLVGCQVQRNVYSDDGRVLLIERGSHMDGEYRITTVKPGTVRIPVLWTRLRTPNGVTVDLDSPATGPLGESGIDGHVDNRWGSRIGAAMLLSLIDDSVKLVIQNQASDRNADTIVLPSTTGNTSKLAEKVLESTINIPPLIYQNQGEIVGVYVARDVDFSGVYQLKASGR